MKIESYKSFEYREVYLITVTKGDYIFKTESIGFAHRSEIPMDEKLALSSISTRLTKNEYFEVNLLTSSEIQNILKEHTVVKE